MKKLLENLSDKGVSIDSRTIRKGEIFIAIKGKNYDGHDFIDKAVKKGASAIVASRRIKLKKNIPLIQVPNTVGALGEIAAYNRRRFNIPVIGITGSTGKTSVKEMTAHILGAKFKVLKNKGTENNFIGLPLTLLKLNSNHTAAVLEMGANHVGEIDRLSSILQPTLGLITNIGPSHLKYFKNLNTVLKAKSEILNHLPDDQLILNGDDRMLARIYRRSNSITFGLSKKCSLFASGISAGPDQLEFDLNGETRFKLNVSGAHNVYNALAGIAIASHLGMDLDTIKRRLASFKSLPMRMNVGSIKGVTFINDAYNASPLSAKCAIEFLTGWSTKAKKILVMGDMLELGRRCVMFHRDVGELAARLSIDRIITVGRLSKHINSTAQANGIKKEFLWQCKNTDEAASVLSKICKRGDIVLVKGSRAMAMEGVIKEFRKASK